MASALDKLREHTAALQAVANTAQGVERVLERVQTELVPLVSDLQEVRRETEKIRKQQDIVPLICPRNQGGTHWHAPGRSP